MTFPQSGIVLSGPPGLFSRLAATGPKMLIFNELLFKSKTSES
jgi:hypothetical protein